jgi:hypothetical protein
MTKIRRRIIKRKNEILIATLKAMQEPEPRPTLDYDQLMKYVLPIP